MILSRMGSVVLNLDGDQIPVSYSCGMTQYQGHDTPETMIKRADERLYAAKAKKRTGDATDRTAGRKPVAASKNPESNSHESSVSQRELGTRPGLFRRGPRIQKQIAIILIGSDLEGRVFTEQTSTVELSRHGSMVVSQRKLAPDQEMIIRRQDTNNEAAARIVRKAGSQSDTYIYGLELLCSNFDIWGIEFARLSESEEETIRMMFECTRCKTRETVDNSDHESEGSAANTAVVRSCSRCGSVTTWTRILPSDLDTSVTGKREVRAVEVKVADVE
jgi:hypothetical protein